MADIRLFDYQLDAIGRMKNGCILCGGVGSGKSLTAISYYYLQNGGNICSVQGDEYVPMDDPPPDLYIITTARKRDTFEWEKEMAPIKSRRSQTANFAHAMWRTRMPSLRHVSAMSTKTTNMKTRRMALIERKCVT